MGPYLQEGEGGMVKDNIKGGDTSLSFVNSAASEESRIEIAQSG